MKEITHPAEYISRVDINPLWGRKHIVWDLRPDVNILSGVNGIGKSTIMRKMAQQMEHGNLPSVTITYEPAEADGIPFDVLHGGESSGLGRLLSRYAYCKADRQTFYRVADELFAVTEKTIVRTPDEILFRQDGEVLTTDQLSSGERQMLAILLTVLVEDSLPYVLFMDEPEVSLHIDWQQRLIDMILDLNPNVQIILTTHSPAVIMNGWMDHVTEVSDITS